MTERYIPEEARQFKAKETPDKNEHTGPLSKLKDSMLTRVLATTLALGSAGSVIKQVEASPDAGRSTPELATAGVDSPDTGYTGSIDIASDPELAEVVHTVDFMGETWGEKELNDFLLEGIRGAPDNDGRPSLLGDYTDDCSDALQCFVYYGDQLERRADSLGYDMLEEGIEKLSDKTPGELEFIGLAIRSGFVEKTGRGWISSMSEVGRDRLNKIPKEKRAEFYKAQFDRHVEAATNIYEMTGADSWSDEEQIELAEQLGEVMKSETLLHTQAGYTEWKGGITNGTDFEKWFYSGDTERGKSGEEQLDLEFDRYLDSIKKLYTSLIDKFSSDPDKSKQEKMAEAAKEAFDLAKLEYKLLRKQIFENEMKKNQAGIFSGDRAERWQQRAEIEENLIGHIGKIGGMALKK